MIAAFINMSDVLRFVLIGVVFVLFIVGMIYALKIEQVAGYYECGKCHHKYVPTYKTVLFAQHINRTRYMRCPKCNQKSWNKKVLK